MTPRELIELAVKQTDDYDDIGDEAQKLIISVLKAHTPMTPDDIVIGTVEKRWFNGQWELEIYFSNNCWYDEMVCARVLDSIFDAPDPAGAIRAARRIALNRKMAGAINRRDATAEALGHANAAIQQLQLQLNELEKEAGNV